MSDAQGVPPTAKQRGKVAPAKFAHCVLRTTPERVPALVAWYKALLEAEAIFENPILCFMTYDDEHHRVAIVGFPGLAERPEQTVGVDHIAFTYGSLADLIHTYERLKAAGTTPAVCIHHGPTVSLYYLDPDKNQVELQIDTFESEEALIDFMKSGHFARNPIGVVFDPEDLAKRFHEGVPEAELTKPLDGPPPGLGDFPSH